MKSTGATTRPSGHRLVGQSIIARILPLSLKLFPTFGLLGKRVRSACSRKFHYAVDLLPQLKKVGKLALCVGAFKVKAFFHCAYLRGYIRIAIVVHKMQVLGRPCFCEFCNPPNDQAQAQPPTAKPERKGDNQ
ncbi:MAG TPA: hypothetical protein VKA94_04110 [Hyphomicrobiales bacterium]|nr:hypothetical protein [Hyphomicrobiales bacterium]